MQYRVTHITEYHYGLPATVSHSAVHMLPRKVPNQTWQHFDLTVTPTPDVFEQRLDFFGNAIAFATVQHSHNQLIIQLRGTVDAQPRQPLLENMSRPWEQVRDSLITDLTDEGLDAYQFAFDSPLAPGLQLLQDYTLKSFTPSRPILDAAKDRALRTTCSKVHSLWRHMLLFCLIIMTFMAHSGNLKWAQSLRTLNW